MEFIIDKVLVPFAVALLGSVNAGMYTPLNEIMPAPPVNIYLVVVLLLALCGGMHLLIAARVNRSMGFQKVWAWFVGLVVAAVVFRFVYVMALEWAVAHSPGKMYMVLLFDVVQLLLYAVTFAVFTAAITIPLAYVRSSDDVGS